MPQQNRVDQPAHVVRAPGLFGRGRIRRALIAACLVALLPLGWRVQEVIAELDRERQARTLYAQGLTLYLNGRPQEAASLFRQAIVFAPLAAEIYGDLAEAEVRQGNVDAGVDTYRRLLAIYPYSYFGSLYRQLGFIELRADRNDDARADLEQAVKLDPRDWHAYYLLGHAYRRLGDTQAARVSWRRVLDLQPDYQPARDQIRHLDE
jgi:tetratricopeptide (TPR) repeat protein